MKTKTTIEPYAALISADEHGNITRRELSYTDVHKSAEEIQLEWDQMTKVECVEGLLKLINKGAVFIQRNDDLSTALMLGDKHWRKLYELVGAWDV